MSKKRERESKVEASDIDPAASAVEALLFQRAESNPTDNKPSSSKRSKSNTKQEDVAPVSTAIGSPEDLGPHPAALAPTSALRHCDGFDVVRKGSRGRGRQLMVLPGALGLGNGGVGGVGGGAGRLGTLKNVASSCPVLYVEFPQVWLTMYRAVLLLLHYCCMCRVLFWHVLWVLSTTPNSTPEHFQSKIATITDSSTVRSRKRDA